MHNPIFYLLVFYAINCVNCDSCVTYNFEESFNELFSVGEVCASMGAQGELTLGNFSSTSVNHPFSNSTSFISPDTIPSCISSFIFPMSNEGRLEVNVYMDAEPLQAQIQILVNKVEEEGDDSVAGVFFLTPAMSSYQRGWNTLTHTIIANEVFNGYITMSASSAEGSKVYVDSFRYIPNEYEIDDCVIYMQDTVPEVEPEPDSCMAYNFENDFNDLFSNSRWCTSMTAEGEWTLGNYSMTSIEPPHPASTSFISPSTTTSCTSSFTFPMRNDGTFEVNVYMDANEPSNQLLVLVNEVVEEGDDLQVALLSLTPGLPIYQEGWNLLSVNLSTTGTYEGYVTLMAVAAEGSTLLVDSFRYVPPSHEGNNCEIYSTETEPDEPNPGQNTTEENISNGTTENYPNTTEENDTNQTEDDNTVDINSDTCVTYNFEENFNEDFSYSGMCITSPATGQWTIGNYSLTSIETPHPASRSFISPGAIMSCTSSFTFLMSNSGTFEVNVYIDANEMPSQLLVFVNELVEGGDDRQITTIPLSPNQPTYEKGWNTLTASLGGNGTYIGYVTFMGAVTGDSNLLVDSFRYIPPEYDIEACLIYTKEPEPGEIASTTTTETISELTTTTENAFEVITTTENTSEVTTTTEPISEVTTTTELISELTTTTELISEVTTISDSTTEVTTNTEPISEVTTTTEPISEVTTTSDSTTEVTTESDPNWTEENNSTPTEEDVTTESPVTVTVTPDAENETTEENETEDIDEENSSEVPEIPALKSNFWNPFTIAMAAALSLIALSLISLCGYECGKRRSQDKLPLVYKNYNDVDLPPGMRVPRVNQVYPEPRVLAY